MGAGDAVRQQARYLGFVGALALALVSALSGCTPATGPGHASAAGGTPSSVTAPSAPSSTRTPATSCASLNCAAAHVQVFVEPEAGEAPIVHAIEGATTSVWVEVYILTDRAVVYALEDAATRGVDVRVLLEAHAFGEGDVGAAQTLEELNAAGVQARQADPAFHYTHEKALIVDHATAYILTSNLSRSGLGGSSLAANREYGVIDTDRDDVAEVEAIFHADWTRAIWSGPGQARLVVSPVNARAELSGLIASARTTLWIEDEEMYDRLSEDALIAAARRGVSVEVVLPSSALAASGPDVAYLAQGGVHVRSIVAPYMHAKLLVVDGALAFTGSENFSAASLDENRELGIIIGDASAVGVLSHSFGQDWAAATEAG